MRISDWSSDVCSSDLDVREQHISAVEQAFGKEARGGAPYRQAIRLARPRGLDDLLDELPRANGAGRVLEDILDAVEIDALIKVRNLGNDGGPVYSKRIFGAAKFGPVG